MPIPRDLIMAVATLNPTWYLIAFAGIMLDLASGFVIKGVLPRKVSSSIMREGLVHKAWEVAIIMAAALADVALAAGMDIGLQVVSTATCAYITLMEIASVCENALDGNAELASAPLIRYVAKAKEQADAADEDDQGKHARRQ